MSRINPNSLRLRPTGGGPEDLDVLLRDFFQSEMPQPWPELRAPVERTPTRAATRWTSMRSRLALAASVGLLMVGSWALSARLPEYGAVSIEPAHKSVGNANENRRLLTPYKANNSTNKTVAPSK
jgi:hypothetical protein